MALQKVVAPGRDFVVTPGVRFRGVPFIMRRFRSRVVTDLDKSYVQMWVETKKTNKQGLHCKLEKFSARLWFNIIKWCHPKMVTPGSGRPS